MHLFATQKKMNEILVAMHLLRAYKGEEKIVMTKQHFFASKNEQNSEGYCLLLYLSTTKRIKQQ